MADIEKLARLRAEYIPRANEDAIAALESEREQARLVLFGNLAALAAILSAAFSTNKSLCAAFVTAGCWCLAIGAPLGWSALGILGGVRSLRSAAAYNEMNANFAAATGGDASIFAAELQANHMRASRLRETARLMVLGGALMGWMALSLVMIGAIETISKKCSPTVWFAISTWWSGVFH